MQILEPHSRLTEINCFEWDPVICVRTSYPEDLGAHLKLGKCSRSAVSSRTLCYDGNILCLCGPYHSQVALEPLKGG